MGGTLLVCAMLATGADPGPPPRAGKPGVSLILVEEVTGDTGTVDRRRVLRVGVRDGKLLPAEKVWEGDQAFLGHFGAHRVAQDRYFITRFGGVIDLRDGKVLNDTESGDLCAVDGEKVFYWTTNTHREDCLVTFDLAARKKQTEVSFGKSKWTTRFTPSPDRLSAIETGPVADELILHQPGAQPKSLGKGFRIDIGPLSSTFGPTPVLWLNNGTFLAQRGNGNLVTVDLAGKVTELLTIKDAPKNLIGPPHLFRDGSDRIVYTCGGEAYTIDVGKKAWEKSEWLDLGHGFEASWERREKFGHKLRHNGKEFASINCWPHTAKTAPGLLAVEAQYGQEARGQPECVAVWSTAVGEWQTVKLWPHQVVGWVKEK